MFHKFYFLFFTLLLTSCSTIRLPDEIIDKELFTVILGDFQYKGSFRQIPHVGAGFRDALRGKLDENPYFDVLDRDAAKWALKEIRLMEQGLLRDSGRLRKELGRNTKYLIRGVVTDLDTQVAASVWRDIHSESLLGYGSQTALDSILNLSFDTQVDVISFKLVIYDLETHEVYYTESVTGESYSANVDYSGMNFDTSLFLSKPLGKATDEALEKAVKYITEGIPKEKYYPSVLTYHGKNTFIAGDKILISGGKVRGMEQGSVWQLVSEKERLVDREGRFAGYGPELFHDAFIRVDVVNDYHAEGVVLKGEFKKDNAVTIVRPEVNE